MKVTDFTYFLKHPSKVVEPIHTNQLEDIIEEYPYFQAARALHLKGLKNLNSYKYNKALKVTAAFTADRDILFNYITSKDFLKHDEVPDRVITKDTPKKEINSETPKKILIEESEDRPLPQNEKDADQILDPKLFKSKIPEKQIETYDAKPEIEKENSLAIGTPLAFKADEKFSFSEWLSLASKQPISRNTDNKTKKEPPKDQPTKASPKQQKSRREKFDRIDKFIANNPKIVPTEKNTVIDVSESVKLDKNELMTETLARVYLEQKKYKKAIQAYKILSLKYPEKSSFFADRIKTVEKIQKDNNKT